MPTPTGNRGNFLLNLLRILHSKRTELLSLLLGGFDRPGQTTAQLTSTLLLRREQDFSLRKKV